MLKLILAVSLILPSAFAQNSNVIPKPNELIKKSGSFQLSAETRIIAEKGAEKTAKLLRGYLKPATGFSLTAQGSSNQIILKLDKNTASDKASYTLQVSPKKIIINASDETGLFYGCQTLRQLLPAQIFSKKRQKGVKWTIPSLCIKDAPRFGWRGLMLDSSRHFQTVTEVKRFIDLMAMHKFNVFHWHLTDSHGWRIEIKKYPKLTEVGAWRDQPDYPKKGKKGRYGGFYTQEEIKEVVAYAKARHITIVPEIDMPGHSFAAVASYPHLGCTQKGQYVDYFFTYPANKQSFPNRRGKTDVLCASRPKTLEFCRDVLDEVITLFPSQYIHIGGDEVEKHVWKHCQSCQSFIKDNALNKEDGLQSWFIQQLDHYLTAKGKRLLGWDEILQGGLAQNATVMSWQGEKGGIRAAKMGHDVVMSPQTYIYLDHGQSHSPLEPPHWPGHKPLNRVYNYEPIPSQLSTEEAKHILGVQANVWTAFIHEQWKLDLSTWPRASAVAEVAWSAKEARNYGDFYTRMENSHFKRLDHIGVNYWRENSLELGQWSPTDLKPNQEISSISFNLKPLYSKLKNEKVDIVFSYTKGAHALRIEDVALFENGKLVSRDQHDGHTGGSSKANNYTIDFSKVKGKGELTLKVTAYGDGGNDSYGKITASQVLTKRVK